MSFRQTLMLVLVSGALAVISLPVFFNPSFRSGDIKIANQPPSSSAQARLLGAVNRTFSIEALDKNYSVKPKTLKTWLEEYYRPYTNRREFRPDSNKIADFLSGLSKNIDRQAVNARLNFDESGKFVEVNPPKPGLAVNLTLSAANITGAFMRGQSSVALVIEEVEPLITLEKASRLGISELLGRGESDFGGSSESRVNNIGVGSEIFNGVILAPGEEFSFNKILGPIDAATGYQPELVIKGQKLIPEFGGGLCQVSTTLFRAAMAAGLAIIERHPHSLPVRYYNPQGFDATIYPDNNTDLRFKNDTPGHILIQSKITDSILAFEIFGKSDGRQVTITGPIQYEINPDGSIKTWLKRAVTGNGQAKKDVFYSSYKSPSLFPIVRNPLE